MEREWKLAFVANLGYASMPAEDVITSLAAIGYQGVEWTTSHFDAVRPLAELQSLVQQTRDAGLEVSRIMAHEDLVTLDDAVRLERIRKTVRVIEAAGECRVANVGTMTGPAPWDSRAPKVGRDISESAAWAQVLEAYEAFLAAAERSGVTITSEGVFGMVAHDLYSHLYLMDRAASSRHKVNLDPSHGALYGNLDIGWVIREWGDRIGHVHLKDAAGQPEMGRFLFPLLGEGLVDWRAFFGGLGDIGYRGFCSVEFESFAYYRQVLRSDPEAAARLSHQLVTAMVEADENKSRG